MRLVQGYGLNDADYAVVEHSFDNLNKSYKIIWRCPFYKTWADMLRRCYGTNKPPSYSLASVCEEWHTFSRFREWMASQHWKDKTLDKDLLVQGNKVYSPATCVFVTKEVNGFLTERKSSGSHLPVGVNLDSYTSRYKATIRSGGAYITIGRFDTPEEAHSAWLAYKLELAKELAGRQSDAKVAKALIDRYSNYQNR